ATPLQPTQCKLYIRLTPSYAPAAAVDVLGAEDVGAASACGKRRSSKGKGGRGGGGGSGGGGGGSSGGGGGTGGGSGDGIGGFDDGGGGTDGSGSRGGSGSGGGRAGGAQQGGSGSGHRQQQQRQSEIPSPQQLCEWFSQHGASGGSGSCPYVIRTGDRAGQTCGKPHTQHRCFSRLDGARRAEFGDEAERLHWAELLRSGVAIFDLDYHTILAAIYALYVRTEGDCYLCVPSDSGIEAAALCASDSSLPGTAPAEALHTFTLDSCASHCIFCNSTTITPLSASVPVRLADPSGGPVLARSSLSSHVWRTAALQDAMVTTTTPGGQRVSICTCTPTGCHLTTFTRRPGSSLYTLATTPPQVAASTQVSASGPIAPPCSCRLLSHQTLLWHHRLGHPSLSRLRGMRSRLLVSGLPRSLPPHPPSPAPPCLPCVEGRQRDAPHSSLFPPTTAPLQTLHMDVWGPARISGQGRERYFLLVVDDYMRYTTVFPLRSKGEVPDVLIPWIRAVRLQLRERFNEDLPVLRLHSDRGGEFSSDLLRDFCRGEGILYSTSGPVSPCRRPRPHYVSDASVFQVWGSRAFIRDTSADKLSTRAIPFVFLGFPPDAPGWRFYHPTSHRVFPSQYVTFDGSIPFYRLFPYCSALPPPHHSSLFQVDPLSGTVPVEVAVESGAPPGAASGGAAFGGAEPAHAEPGGAEPEGAGCGGAGCGGAEPWGTEPR
ncbi:unnamed protein product, partial [Closterium sp. NIES-54]